MGVSGFHHSWSCFKNLFTYKHIIQYSFSILRNELRFEGKETVSFIKTQFSSHHDIRRVFSKKQMQF